MPHSNKLASMPLGKLMVSLAVPTIAAQVINALYNIVDRMYIGRIDGVGSLALAGLGICYPLIIIVSAFAALFGAGGAPRAAIKMGEGDNDTAEKIQANALSCLVITSFILMIVFLSFKEPLLYMFGATDNTISFASEYFTIYMFGTLFVQLSLGLNSFITAQGFSRVSMCTVLVGAITNIILDPILIFGFDLGVKGAAIATVTAQFVSAAWVLYFTFSDKAILRIRKKNLKIQKNILISMVSLGVAPFIMQSTESAVQFVLNSGMKRYGGVDTDYLIGTMSILISTMQFVNMPVNGLTQGVQPIMSYNFGAKNMDRVRLCFKYMLRACMIYTITTCIITVGFPQIFAYMFTNDAYTIELTIKYLPIFMAGIGIFGIQMACQTAFMALGQAKKAMFFALLRKVIILIPLALIFPMFMGYEGIFIAEPVADITSALSVGITFYFFSRKIFPKKHNSKEI